MEELSAEINIRQHIRRSELKQQDLERFGGLSRRASFDKSLLLMEDKSLADALNGNLEIGGTKHVEVGGYNFNLVRRRVRKEMAAQKLRQAVNLFQNRKSTKAVLRNELLTVTPKQTDAVDNPQSGVVSFERPTARNAHSNVPTPLPPMAMKGPRLTSPKLVMARSKQRKALEDAERIKAAISMADI